jgi:hypothetical protein
MKKFRDFESAREFVRSLNLKSGKEWLEYCKSGNKPDDIPASPDKTCKKDWQGYGNWLGTGNIANRDKVYRPFTEAREFVRSLGLKNNKEWKEYCKSGNKPDDIPTNPWKIYKNEFKGMGDFLATGTVRNQDKVYRSYKEAREFVRALNLKGQKEWKEYCKSGNKPDDIPSSPNSTYKKDFKGVGDWLGTGNIANRDKVYRLFNEAREFVRSLGLKNYGEWEAYCKSGNKPDDIPTAPWKIYKNEFKEMGDFLGTGTTRNFRPYKETRNYVRNLKLKGIKEWYEYCKSGNKPGDIPANPHTVYKNEFKGVGDFLGTGTVASYNKQFRSFTEAREFARALNLKAQKEWEAYCKSGNKPDDIPTAPWKIYKNEFKEMGDFLGTGTTRNFRPYKEAREFARSLNLKAQKEWYAYCKSGNKPNDIPQNIRTIYKNDFKGWGDWLGTGTIATKYRVFRSFTEAREFARALNLKGQKEWFEYTKSDNKPDDIPSSPNSTYKNEFKGMDDWLGNEYRSYKEAREFVRKLNLKNTDEWKEYCKSGNKPDDIPSTPWIVYKEWKKK